ncbi:MAG: hypothetical protein A3I03_14425 [Candidatus Rokubacteria bacterium RIFCSPLOWO2_02_FULL_68_19]|nr:MAG: hypothetical protein A3I03_14425 [Candidatus Rokubacteria bacterium RIFCSPLOWO2_02_FULL_68_19]
MSWASSEMAPFTGAAVSASAPAGGLSVPSTLMDTAPGLIWAWPPIPTGAPLPSPSRVSFIPSTR